uniref:Rhodanese domain-containing protein n=1 Tax=Oncorhynchus tshawytscha TaxID=74940 RepID=A0AAZ3P903_ONCTS
MLLVLCALSVVVVAEETHCGGTPDRLCDVKPEAVYYKEPPITDSEVSYKQLKTMFPSSSIQLFDVRNPDEFEAGHIPGSTNVPLGELQKALRLSSDQFKQRFGVRAPHKEDSSIVVYCQRGRRSATALDIMWALGFSRARHYAGGYSDWVQREEQQRRH